MKNLLSFFFFSTILFSIVSCSRDNDENSSNIIVVKEKIPLKFHGIWNIKYKDDVDISATGSHFKFSEDIATIAINEYTNNNGAITIHQNSLTFPAWYQTKPVEQIMILDGGIKLEVKPSQKYPDYLDFTLLEKGKNPIVYTAKKK